MLENPLFSFIPALKNGAIGNGYDWNQATMVTVCGLVIVFSMLILLVIIIAIFGRIMDRVNGVERQKPVKKAAHVSSVPVAPVVTVEEDNDEIIAVIAAAVDAIYSDTGVKPVIRRIRPAASRGTRSPWASAGVFENTRAF